jgi:hypothetical protein
MDEIAYKYNNFVEKKGYGIIIMKYTPGGGGGVHKQGGMKTIFTVTIFHCKSIFFNPQYHTQRPSLLRLREEPINFCYTQILQLVMNRKLNNYVLKPSFLQRQASIYHLEISRLPRFSGCNSSSFALLCHTSRSYVSGTPYTGGGYTGKRQPVLR